MHLSAQPTVTVLPFSSFFVWATRGVVLTQLVQLIILVVSPNTYLQHRTALLMVSRMLALVVAASVGILGQVPLADQLTHQSDQTAIIWKLPVGRSLALRSGRCMIAINWLLLQ